MNDSMEFQSPKIDGQGDGLRKITFRKRQAIQSSRKFNAKVPKDETLKLKLEKALVEMRSPRRVVSHSCIQKANSVAEITPTQTRTRKKVIHLPKTPSNDESSSDVALFATPRPFDNDLVPRCPRQKAVCLVYQKLMLCAWRRCKSKLRDLTNVYIKQKSNVTQLELQVEVLSSLRNSECDKRHEALNEIHNQKLRIVQLESENKNLNEELQNTIEALDNTKANLFLTKEDLQHCSEQLKRVKGQLKKKMEEKMDLIYKLTEQEREMQTKDGELKKLEEELRITEKNLQNTRSNYDVKQEEITEVLEQLQNEIDMNQSLKEEMQNMKVTQIATEEHSRGLENELSNYVMSCEQLAIENLSIRNDLLSITTDLEQQKRSWFQKACSPDFTKVSVDVLRRVGEVVIPLVLNRGVYF